MSPIIQIQNLGKKYKLAEAQRYLALRDIISNAGKELFNSKKTEKEFWALQNINLDIEAGERIGIIGRNGAGKSTLLKILSRITPPTCGHVKLKGRVASLLEVGTGFHPELTGRENIYLNGSILGLKKKEIDTKLDEIIDFSGVEKFIDTPLKHYSSGMQLRLAFSVAAHLEPEILLIDEVLAVGDIEFQKKCLGKMEEVSKSQGRTILFVSHNMDSIRRFCNQTILLNEGIAAAYGSTEKIISQYVSDYLQTTPEINWENGVLSYTNAIKLNRAFLHDSNGVVKGNFEVTEKIGLTLEYEVLENDIMFTHGINVYNAENINIFDSHDVTSPLRLEKRKKGKYSSTAWIPGNLLPEGLFSAGVALFLPNPLDVYIHERQVLVFETYTDLNKLSARGNYAAEFPGVIRPLLHWETVFKD